MTSVTIIGLGNIGSPVVPLVARMPLVSAITLVDSDSYDESNLVSQAIDRSATGLSKVEMQSARIRSINSRLPVRSVRDRIENVPVATLRDSILLSCVDNRRARQTINRIAWRCGSPWIDAAVGENSLVRISTFVPGESMPCLECGWDERSYALLEQDYPCDGGGSTVAATDAPAELGALAASLQAAELRKLICGPTDATPLSGSQLMFDTSSYVGHLNHVRRNGRCRFDHATWELDALQLEPSDSTLADLFDALDPDSDPVIRVEGHSFVSQLHCVNCGEESKIALALGGRLAEDIRTCNCGGRMLAPGYFCAEAIRRTDASREDLHLKLDAVGFRAGDLLTVTSQTSGARHFEIGGRPDNG